MDRNREILGIFLIILGALFLLANNKVGLSWSALWPIYPLLLGIFLLRLYATQKRPDQLFWGLFVAQLAVFFFFFSSGLVSWDAIERIWPLFLLILATSLIAFSSVGDRPHSELVVGLLILAGAVAAFLVSSGTFQPRMSRYLVRFWPLVLIAAGVLIFLRARREREPPPTLAPADEAWQPPSTDNQADT